MADSYTVGVHYEIKYTTSKPVPIKDIVESLISLDKLLKRTPAFVEKAFADIHVIDTHVYISKVESGSLIKDFIVEYVFRGKENAEDAKRVYDNIMKDNTALRTLVCIGIGGFLMYGALKAISSGQPSSHIEAYNNTIIALGGTVDLSAEDFRATLEAVTDKKSLAREAVGAIRPAKNDSASSIEMSGIQSITIPPEVISEVPDKYEPPQAAEREVRYTNVDLVVYASDRDNAESGWAGIIPTVVDRRTSIVLADEIDPSKLHGRLRVRADVAVHERFVASKKKYEPKTIEVLAVN